MTTITFQVADDYARVAKHFLCAKYQKRKSAGLNGLAKTAFYTAVAEQAGKELDEAKAGYEKERDAISRSVPAAGK